MIRGVIAQNRAFGAEKLCAHGILTIAAVRNKDLADDAVREFQHRDGGIVIGNLRQQLVCAVGKDL